MVCEKVRLKPAYLATETSQSLQSSNFDFGSVGIISRQRTTKAPANLLRADAQADLRLCCSYKTNMFSHDVAHICIHVLKILFQKYTTHTHSVTSHYHSS